MGERSKDEDKAQCAKFSAQSKEWFTVDGRKLQGEPNVKGIYIMNGIPIMATVLPGGTGTVKLCDRISAKTHIPAPHRRVEGSILRWEDVP